MLEHLLMIAWSHSAGLSGPSQTFDHFSGTFPAARRIVACRTGAVRSDVPLRTLEIDSIILCTVSTSCRAQAKVILVRQTRGFLSGGQWRRAGERAIFEARAAFAWICRAPAKRNEIGRSGDRMAPA